MTGKRQLPTSGDDLPLKRTKIEREQIPMSPLNKIEEFSSKVYATYVSLALDAIDRVSHASIPLQTSFKTDTKTFQ